jgi:hypothetical protein
MAANPALAPLIKLPTVLREFAITMDIDPDEILNSPEEAMIYAAIIGRQNMAAQGAPQAAEQQASAGGVQIPGEPGFPANAQGGVEPGMEGGELGEPAAAF